MKQCRDFRLTQYRWRRFLQWFFVILKIKVAYLKEKWRLSVAIVDIVTLFFNTYVYQSLQSRYITIFGVYYRGHNMSTFQLLRRQVRRWRWKRRRSLSSLLHALKLYHSTVFFIDLKYDHSMNNLSNKLFE